MASPSKRREMDVMKLMMSDFEVSLPHDTMNEFFVTFNGPRDTPYEGETVGWGVCLGSCSVVN